MTSSGAWTTLDRIVSVSDDEAEAFRNVPNTLAIFDSHFPRFHVLPGVLILGSMGALCGELLLRRTGRAWRLAGAERVGFRHFVQPGDQIVFTVKLTELGDAEATFSGEASVEGKAVTRARLLRAVPVETAAGG
jgi:3-hydroxyacyl-[acyl-carrier-protein] dehydratase